MTSSSSKVMLALALVLLTPIAVVACGGGGGGDRAAHGDHAAHEGHGEEAGQAGPAMTAMGGEKVDAEGAVRAFDAAPAVGDKAICPVSGEVFIVTDGTATSEHEGKHYAYCCPSCKPRFDADPASFLDVATES